jgi:hypothetical protein
VDYTALSAFASVFSPETGDLLDSLHGAALPSKAKKRTAHDI